uniref:RRM domain-containing protein n=1 Tax=Aegilops tauschii subsp. strangulata TaxID=200361 RepID=A0A452XK59_AEGTS
MSSLYLLALIQVNLPRGYGYVEFKMRADAEKALLYMDGAQIDGNVVKVKFAPAPGQKAAVSLPKALPHPPKRDVPETDTLVPNAEKATQQRPRESSTQRKPAQSPQRRPAPGGRVDSPRRRPDSPPIHPWKDPPPFRRGRTPPSLRPGYPVRRRSPSPPPRRFRSPRRFSPRRGYVSPVRRRSPFAPRRMTPPMRMRSPPRRLPPPYRRSRSPIRRPIRSLSRSISPVRGRAAPVRRGRSSSSFSESPTPPRRVNS